MRARTAALLCVLISIITAVLRYYCSKAGLPAELLLLPFVSVVLEHCILVVHGTIYLLPLCTCVCVCVYVCK